jgi:RNA polymerase-binding transcription factor DksA
MPRIPRRIPHRGAPEASALPERYPEWFALGAIAVPPGWTALVARLFDDLAASLDDDARARFQVAAVREREGRLSVETYAPVPAADPVIARAAAAALRICQSCGAPGKHRRFAGWSATLCVACRKRLGKIRIGGG